MREIGAVLSGLKLEFGASILEVPAQDWDRVAGSKNPFLSHAFLAALENCGCVGPEAGWLPFPGLLRRVSDGRLIGACPSYIKLNSKGEYMFDYHWAEAYQSFHPEQASYYPKLQVAVPFSPVTGSRILLESIPESRKQELRTFILRGLVDKTEELEFSSLHITFCEREERESAAAVGPYLERVGEQYHWFNEAYDSFDDFLATLTSRKRKNIRKERQKANSHPVSIHTFHGHEMTEELLVAFFAMYENTCLRKWGQPYLNLAFFRELAENLGSRLVIFMVRTEPEKSWVAGAWNLRGEDTLFGRNWGCLEHYDLLHFEVCYYRAIEYAIDKGLARVEAGAQGMHKIQRGYRPRFVHSAHHIVSAPFRDAIAQYLRSEIQETEWRVEALTHREPFKVKQNSESNSREESL